MTGEQFLKWAAEQMRSYERSEGFEDRLAELERLQAEGRKLTLQDMATTLAIPLWLAELGALRAHAHRLGQVVAPESSQVH
jgi:hypothetical protein